MEAEILAAQRAFAANADYEADGSATKARKFVSACTVLLGLRPSIMRHAGTEENQFSTVELRHLREQARGWLAANAAADGATVRIFGTSTARSG